MNPIYVVKDEEAALARKIETKLMALSPESGILFVGVSVTPETPSSKAVFRVWIGCNRDFDERTYPPLVEVALRDEIKKGLLVETVAHRGIARKVS